LIARHSLTAVLPGKGQSIGQPAVLPLRARDPLEEAVA